MRTTQKQGYTFPHWCAWNCGNLIASMADFKDDISRQEYLISGLCQQCQDQFFNEMEE